MGVAWPGRATCIPAALMSVALVCKPCVGTAVADQIMLEPGRSCMRLGFQDTLDEALCAAFAQDILGLDTADESQYIAGSDAGAYGCTYIAQDRPVVLFSTHGNESYESPVARSICIGSTTSTPVTTTRAAFTSTASTLRSTSAAATTTSTSLATMTRTTSTSTSSASSRTASTTSTAAAHLGHAALPRVGGLDTRSASAPLVAVVTGALVSTALFLCACYWRSKAPVHPCTEAHGPVTPWRKDPVLPWQSEVSEGRAGAAVVDAVRFSRSSDFIQVV